ncbi:alpha-L-fucosidase [Marinilongibacter aquaticus]|uniref:alpha-L-fucosidase n=1 Tax=Marinilongibacter aquaticus TaxID=2975157 RepID=UPI0021BD96A3|nr:alpha-L-fucosidase [Marinilongibacter aquaticus]UBM58957.1 alpha-L-fucosidase [Marinilongibacter aquaticus]
MKKVKLLFFVFLLQNPAFGQEAQMLNLNKPAREQWFAEMGFGMFIHWSFDVQLGMVISHSMVGASDDYLDRYVHDLPKTFNPKDFDPSVWAKAARMAGMKYVVFTTKHHNGFCMYDTQTTDFNIMHTPFGKDITKMIVDAFREEGLAIGLYFSPDDFHFLYTQGTLISRARPEAQAQNNPELNAYVKGQMRELMKNYGKIDLVFLDGLDQFGKTELAKVCWEIDPNVVVTRGAIPTPEQETPDSPIPSPWEACYTFGDQWQFRPTNENYKSAKQAITELIEIRAKGGNLLLNFGPDAMGNFPPEQAGALNEISLWMFINQEAFDQTIPLQTIHEGHVWFLKQKDSPTVYAFILEDDWKFGERKNFSLKSFTAQSNTKISVLGHNGKVLEYAPDVDPAPQIKNNAEGIEISVMRAQRIYNDRKWPNPIVVKLENLKIK